MEALSTTLTFLMAKIGIKSAELARKTGVGQPVIYRLMTGVTENPQVLTIKPIADFFEVSIDQLLGFTPLDGFKSSMTHDLNNKLSTVKTIGSVFVDLMPTLISGYQTAVSANLVEETIPADILPLLSLNATNLLKSANQIQELLIKNTSLQDSI